MDGSNCCEPNALPVTQPTVSEHWRQLTALSQPWKFLTGLILCLSTTGIRQEGALVVVVYEHTYIV